MVGKALKEMRKSEGLTQEQLAMELNLSKSMICEIERGNRKLQEDVAHYSLKNLDNPLYALDIVHEFSDGYTAPRLSGNAVEWHRLAMEEFVLKETQEVIQILEDVSLVKAPEASNLEELKQVEVVIGELIDAETAIGNLKAILADQYKLSLKECHKERKQHYKKEGWIE
ncbi:helix-turn-helix domain-containing protein [Virgibacillus halodenitrificans]|uniref:helix-turn-helix domain-containing protein n=1 Tax=Virgibacillus halodenitrificans TaxID=1482 RepID=UPI00136C49C2|nr:helix-turn-helix transcriptional regulator [Virgibacillus halodenitrificans]MYL44625.1 helix-turn-helix domain-containing protein [Virgibacillus halodenitrificans]MYL56163.1 helix-turn-helix domain-containing protein [Virgibacillus halodenitrificans]